MPGKLRPKPFYCCSSYHHMNIGLVEPKQSILPMIRRGEGIHISTARSRRSSRSVHRLAVVNRDIERSTVSAPDCGSPHRGVPDDVAIEGVEVSAISKRLDFRHVRRHFTRRMRGRKRPIATRDATVVDDCFCGRHLQEERSKVAKRRGRWNDSAVPRSRVVHRMVHYASHPRVVVTHAATPSFHAAT